MRPTMLQLPQRSSKPRADGLTMMVDGGLPTGQFQDVVESGAEFLDFVKFGWGTAIVTTDLQRKIDVLKDVGVDFYFGGTLFEKFLLQDRYDDFRDLCLSYGCQYVEVSNGTIDLPHIEKAGYVRKLAAEFKVVSEVGFKDSERSELLAPDRWIECIHEDLEAGAFLVTLESRESGSSGICRPNGELRFGLIEEILDSDVNPAQLLFEAPSTQLQCYFVRRIGSDVNLGNIPSTASARARDDPARPPGRHPGVLRERGVVRESRDVFHLAIPVDDLDEAEAFYVGALGCKLARRYADRITLDFFGDQLVCHLSDEQRPPAAELSLYPRHFGVTFREARDFDALYELCVQRKIEFFADVSTRFDGLVEVHRTFVLRDPSDNLVEFKHYADPRMMY